MSGQVRSGESLSKKLLKYGENIKYCQMSLSWLFYLLTGTYKHIKVPSYEIATTIRQLPPFDERHHSSNDIWYNEVDSIDNIPYTELLNSIY